MLEDIRSEFLALEAWRTTFAELVATLLFVFLGAGAVVASGTLTNGELTATRLVAIALAHGLAIALLAFATANISGGHINPAVTFAALLTKKINVARGLMFMVAQLIGAVVGALLLLATIPDAADTNLGAHALGPGVSVGMGLLMEIIVTFALVFVIFATAVDRGGMGNLAPLAIGLTVLVDHLLAVPITGASMNPARSFGPALVAGQWANHWIYWVAPLLGAAIAGLVYQFAFINRPR
jgi:MIP family channel proteins